MPCILTYVSSACHCGPVLPSRLASNCPGSRGAGYPLAGAVSQLRTVAWLKAKLRFRDISARWRRLSGERSRHRPTRNTTSVGTLRSSNGALVRLLKRRVQAAHRKVR